MDDLVRIPCVLMRGGTSKGPFFLARDLPADVAARDALLIEVMGSGHPLQIDGIGGGHPLSSKVAIVGPPTRPGADVDYLFAQVNVLEQSVDTAPNCGNMLSGVAPFAIEAGLVRAQHGETSVRIHNVNTGALIEARMSTPEGRVAYQGEAVIDGAPGKAAPVLLAFGEAAGSKTGRLLPSGAPCETIDGMEATLIDAATPMVLLEARAFGLSGDETPAALNADAAFLARLEIIRREGGRRMGLGDVSGSVLPKPVLLSPPRRGGTLCARYFMPHACHTALATTGGVGIAIAAVTPGTLAARLAPGLAPGLAPPAMITLEHPGGALGVRLDPPAHAGGAPVAWVVRTARRLFEGAVLARA